MALIRPESGAEELVVESGDQLVIDPDVTRTSSLGPAIGGSGTDIVLRVSGTVESSDEDYYALYLGGSGHDVLIASTGSLTGIGGASLFLDSSRVINEGTISGFYFGISFFGVQSTIINRGDIVGVNGGVSLINTPGSVFRNSGTITATGELGTGVQVTGELAGFVMTNDGEISGAYVGAYVDGGKLVNRGLIEGGAIGVHASSELEIINDGTISGQLGVYAGGLEGMDLLNRGVIVGDVVAYAGLESSRVVNRGSISGEIRFNFADDTVINTGAISGLVDLAGGNDVFNGREGGAVRVKGDLGDDRLFGGAFDDVLGGGDGNDVVSGGAGDDILVGGLGRDILTGGAGADQFYFETLVDSTLPERDLIRDFVQGEDRIVLWDLFDEVGPVDVAFIGDAGFSASGGIELRYGARGSQRTEMALDVDGDGAADLILDLGGQLALTEADFQLEWLA